MKITTTTMEIPESHFYDFDPYDPAQNSSFSFWVDELNEEPDTSRKILEAWFDTLTDPTPEAFFEWDFLAYYQLELPPKLLAVRLLLDRNGGLKYLQRLSSHRQSQLWMALLLAFPEFANDPAVPWDRFTASDWSDLLHEHAIFATRCDQWTEFASDDWLWILQKQPQFASRCPIFNQFSEMHWISLAREHPSFLNHPACILKTEQREKLLRISKSERPQ